jgi:hypothetical protein
MVLVRLARLFTWEAATPTITGALHSAVSRTGPGTPGSTSLRA